MSFSNKYTPRYWLHYQHKPHYTPKYHEETRYKQTYQQELDRLERYLDRMNDSLTTMSHRREKMNKDIYSMAATMTCIENRNLQNMSPHAQYLTKRTSSSKSLKGMIESLDGIDPPDDESADTRPRKVSQGRRKVSHGRRHSVSQSHTSSRRLSEPQITQGESRERRRSKCQMPEPHEMLLNGDVRAGREAMSRHHGGQSGQTMLNGDVNRCSTENRIQEESSEYSDSSDYSDGEYSDESSDSEDYSSSEYDDSSDYDDEEEYTESSSMSEEDGGNYADGGACDNPSGASNENRVNGCVAHRKVKSTEGKMKTKRIRRPLSEDTTGSEYTESTECDKAGPGKKITHSITSESKKKKRGEMQDSNDVIDGKNTMQDNDAAYTVQERNIKKSRMTQEGNTRRHTKHRKHGIQHGENDVFRNHEKTRSYSEDAESLNEDEEGYNKSRQSHSTQKENRKSRRNREGEEKYRSEEGELNNRKTKSNRSRRGEESGTTQNLPRVDGEVCLEDEEEFDMVSNAVSGHTSGKRNKTRDKRHSSKDRRERKNYDYETPTNGLANNYDCEDYDTQNTTDDRTRRYDEHKDHHAVDKRRRKKSHGSRLRKGEDGSIAPVFRPRRVSICEKNLQQEDIGRDGKEEKKRHRRKKSHGRKVSIFEEDEEELEIRREKEELVRQEEEVKIREAQIVHEQFVKQKEEERGHRISGMHAHKQEEEDKQKQFEQAKEEVMNKKDTLVQKDQAAYKQKLEENKEQSARTWIESAIKDELVKGADPATPLSTKQFQDAIKDGVVLCRLASVVTDGKVKYSRMIKFKFKLLQNINNFLEACNKYGVPDEELFLATDLYQATNFWTVVATIHALRKQVGVKQYGRRRRCAVLPIQETSDNQALDDLCIVCHKDISIRTEKALECEGCEKWQHISCNNIMTEDEYEKHFNESIIEFQWKCTACSSS